MGEKEPVMNIASLLGGNIVEQVGNALDGLFTSDEERESLKNELAKSDQAYKLESKKIDADLTKSEDENTTKRWLSDNENLVTRLVRPAGLIYMLVVFTAVMFTDGNIGNFKINSAYVPIIETLLTTMIIAYYGSRGVEKLVKYQTKK
jgi:hypothetical protein